MDKNNIKSLLSKTFVSEAKVRGLEVTNKAKEESGKENKKAIKDMEDELSDYDKESKEMAKDSINPVKFNYTDNSEEEYHREMEIMNGQEMIQYDRKPSDKFKERAEEAIAGSSRMGNNPEWANVVVPGQGGDPAFGKKLVKAIKASEKKRNDATPTSKMFGDDWEIVQDHSNKPYAFENTENNKEIIKEKMKRLTFKKPFNGVNNALNLIPESYKVDSKVFEMTDGNESYKVRWEGSLNEGKAVVLMAADKTLVNEDMQKMKHLMGYKSEETLGNLKGTERINEDKNFGDIWKKTKTILSEGIEEWTEKQLKAFDKDGDGTPFEPEDMKMLRKDESEMYEDSLYEMNGAQGEEQQPVNLSDMRTGLLTTLKTYANKMQGHEKEEFLNFVTLMGEYFGKGSGNQDSGLVKTMLDRLEKLMRSNLEKMEPKQQAPGAEMPSALENLEEMDRFEEVFGGMDEE